MASKSSINLLMFYMQCKDMYKITNHLCRLAKEEFNERLNQLPDDVKSDKRFNKVLKFIENVERAEFARGSEVLADAFKEHEEMMSYFSRKRKPNSTNEPDSPSIFHDNWQPPVQAPVTCSSPAPVNDTLNEGDKHYRHHKSSVVPKDCTSVTVINDTRAVSLDEAIPEKDKQRKTEGSTVSFSETLTETKMPAWTRKGAATSPTVLADSFTDLYKIEWQSAHDELSYVLGDKQAIRHLLWIIAKSSIICASFATQQLQDMENSAVGIMVSRDPLNKRSLLDNTLAKTNQKTISKAQEILAEYRCAMGKLSVPMLKQEICRAIAAELGTSLPRRFTGIGNHFISYAEKCIELIWLMYLHEPPMHLEWLTKDQEGAGFRAELYMPYTTAGKVFDYCVWPVVRLHENGPVLRKGVAQGR